MAGSENCKSIPNSYTGVALQLNQRYSEIITNMAIDYEVAMSMIKSKDSQITNLKSDVEAMTAKIKSYEIMFDDAIKKPETKKK